MSAVTPLYFLSGPTASGKTSLAHLLADRLQLRLLSVDSMMVYRDMNIGTAKPTPEEIDAYSYAGVDLVDPGESFSTGKWIKAVSAQLDERPTLAVGGTGLYYRALIDGLDPETPKATSNAGRSVEELQAQIQGIDPQALDRIADPQNPRRLERALSWLENGHPLPSSWTDRSGFPVAVLRRPTEELNLRIRQRAEQMFATGLLEETRMLREADKLAGTAAQAIGYQEALEVLQGELPVEDAVERVTVRTRRYAKRQRTWFRNQMDARWIDIEKSEDPQIIADKIASVWQESGPYPFDRDPYV